MSMIFKFRMLSDENDNFLRDYEIRYDSSLLDFHNFICDDLGFDKSSMSSFFSSDREWNKGREFTMFDMGEDESSDDEAAPMAMEKVVIGQVIHKNNDRLIYLFDMFGDRAMYLELIETGEAESGVTYPRVTLSECDAPNQFDAEAGGSGSGSIFDDAMDDFNNFEGDDSYDDE